MCRRFEEPNSSWVLTLLWWGMFVSVLAPPFKNSLTLWLSLCPRSIGPLTVTCLLATLIWCFPVRTLFSSVWCLLRSRFVLDFELMALTDPKCLRFWLFWDPPCPSLMLPTKMNKNLKKLLLKMRTVLMILESLMCPKILVDLNVLLLLHVLCVHPVLFLVPEDLLGLWGFGLVARYGPVVPWQLLKSLGDMMSDFLADLLIDLCRRCLLSRMKRRMASQRKWCTCCDIMKLGISLWFLNVKELIRSQWVPSLSTCVLGLWLRLGRSYCLY